MKVRAVCAVLVCLALLSGIGFAGAQQYQAGKVVKVEKRESQAPSGGTDAPMQAEVRTYRVSIQLGDKLYVCQYKTVPGDDISWVEGKDVEARLAGKAMYVKKANGKEVKVPILSTGPAGNP